MNNYLDEYNNYLSIFNQQLDIALKNIKDNHTPTLLKQAMEYAISGGGKRVRPVLLYATSKLLGVNISLVHEFAIAIECIHSYSLVHDDLPAMDNDDYRRGKLSTHKKFGEAYGILTGDALLNFAFEYCLNKKNFNNIDLNALKILANFAGYTGMIAGQVYDLQNEHSNNFTEQTLYQIYENKTAKLLTVPLLIASTLADNKYYEQLKTFGYHLGIMFQISDDIMDVEGNIESIGKTPNKDSLEDKLTSIKVYGLKGAIEKKEFHYKKCLEQLDLIKNSDFLRCFCQQMFERKK